MQQSPAVQAGLEDSLVSAASGTEEQARQSKWAQDAHRAANEFSPIRYTAQFVELLAGQKPDQEQLLGTAQEIDRLSVDLSEKIRALMAQLDRGETGSDLPLQPIRDGMVQMRDAASKIEVAKLISLSSEDAELLERWPVLIEDVLSTLEFLLNSVSGQPPPADLDVKPAEVSRATPVDVLLSREIASEGAALGVAGSISYEGIGGIPAGISLVLGEQGRRVLRDTLIELIKNARKYSRQRVPLGIVVKARYLESDRRLMIVVSDNGIGIEDQYKARFAQGEMFPLPAGKQVEERAGIGLAAQRQALEELGGRLQLDASRTQAGVGTTVRFWLPVTPQAASSAPTAAGAEEPPWPAGTGRARGVEEFPPAVRDSLRKADTFTKRVLVLSGHLGWPDQRVAVSSGLGLSSVASWKALDIGTPLASTILSVSDRFHADPIFLLTGQPEEKALRPGTVSDRVRLLMAADGMTQEDLGAAMGVGQPTVRRYLDSASTLNRDTVFRIAQALRRPQPPVLIETGFRSAGVPLARTTGEAGFLTGNVSKTQPFRDLAESLEEGILQAWRRTGEPAAEWESQIAADPNYGYPGLAARLLLARPGTLEQAVYYGLFSQNLADALRERKPLNAAQTSELAADLAKAHRELAELFETTPQLAPPVGYPKSKRSNRFLNPWDIIARLWNRERMLRILDATPVDYRKFKNAILLSSNPEAAIAKKEVQAQELIRRFPILAGKERVAHYYVWTYRNPNAALQRALPLYGRLENLIQRRWVRPVYWGTGVHRFNPDAFLGLVLVRGPAGFQSILDRVEQRDALIGQAVKGPAAESLRSLAPLLPELSSDLEESSAPVGSSQARDLLNRLAAHRYMVEFTMEEIQQLIIQVTARLQQAQRDRALPRDPDQLVLFVQEFSAAGAEEQPQVGQTIRVPVADQLVEGILAHSPGIRELQASLKDSGIQVKEVKNPRESAELLRAEFVGLLVLAPKDSEAGDWRGGTGVPTIILPAGLAAALNEAEWAALAAEAKARGGILYINTLTWEGANRETLVLEMA